MASFRVRAGLPIVLIACVVFLIAVAGAAAASRPASEAETVAPAAVGWSQPIDLTEGNNERWPAIASDTANWLYVTYLAGPNGQVLYKRSEDGGPSWSGAIEIAGDSKTDARPAVAATYTPDGHHLAAVAWIGSDRALYYRAILDGTPQAIERVDGGPIYSSPSLAFDPDRTLHIGYHAYVGTALQALARARTGAGWSDPTNLSEIVGSSDGIMLSPSPNGVHAVWAEFVSNTWEVHYRAYTRGAGWSPKVNVSANQSFSLYPAVTSNDAGNALIAWADEIRTGEWSIYFSQGTSSFPAGREVQNNVFRGYRPGIASGRDGNARIVMASAPLTQIVYSAVNSSGVLEQLGLNDPADRVASPAVTIDAAQFAHVVWEQSNGGASRIVYTRRSNAYPTPVPTATTTPTATPIPPSSLAAPLLIAPIGITVPSSTVDFQWTEVAGGVKYRLEFDTTDQFNSSNKVSTDVTQPSRTVTGTLTFQATVPRANNPQQWFWRVTAIDSAGAVSRFSSEPASFWMPGFEPPVLVSPVEGHTFIVPNDPVRFTWLPADGAEQYLVEITSFSPAAVPPKADGRYQTTVHTATVPNNETSYAPPSTSPSEPMFENNRVYYWHVASLDADGNVIRMSESRSFQKTYPAPVVISPADSFDTAYVDVTMEWLPVGGAKEYEIEIYPYTDFVNVVYAAKSAGTKHTPTRSLPDDEYWFRIRAIDTGGNPGGWSPLRKFKRAWLAKPVLLEPADGAGSAAGAPGCGGGLDGDSPAGRPPESIYLRWKPVPHASRYHVKLTSRPDDLTKPHIEIDVDVARTDWSPPKPLADLLMVEATYYWAVWAIDDTTAPATGVPRVQDPHYLLGPSSETRCFRMQNPADRDDPSGPQAVTPIPFEARGNQVAIRQAPDRYDENGTPVYVGIPPAFVWNEFQWPVFCGDCTHEYIDYYAVTIGYDENMSNFFNTGLDFGPAVRTNPSYRTRALSYTPTDDWIDVDANRGYFVTVSPVFTDTTTTALNPAVYSYVPFNKVPPPGPVLESPAPQQVLTTTPTFQWRELTKIDPGMNKTDAAPLYGYYNPNAPATLPDGSPGYRNNADRAFAAEIDTTGDTYWFPIKYYVLQVALDPDFKSIVLTTTTPTTTTVPVTSTTGVTTTNGITQTTVTTTTEVSAVKTDSTSYVPSSWDQPDGIYYWRVCAVPFSGSDNCDDVQAPRMNWSETRTFVYRKASAITLASDAGSGASANGSLLQWQPLDRAKLYEVQIAADPSFASLWSSGTTGKTAYTPPCISQAGTYYWRVRALFDDGTAGPWTTGPTFTIAGADGCARGYGAHLPIVLSGGSGGW